MPNSFNVMADRTNMSDLVIHPWTCPYHPKGDVTEEGETTVPTCKTCGLEAKGRTFVSHMHTTRGILRASSDRKVEPKIYTLNPSRLHNPPAAAAPGASDKPLQKRRRPSPINRRPPVPVLPIAPAAPLPLPNPAATVGIKLPGIFIRSLYRPIGEMDTKPFAHLFPFTPPTALFAMTKGRGMYDSAVTASGSGFERASKQQTTQVDLSIDGDQTEASTSAAVGASAEEPIYQGRLRNSLSLFRVVFLEVHSSVLDLAHRHRAFVAASPIFLAPAVVGNFVRAAILRNALPGVGHLPTWTFRGVAVHVADGDGGRM